MNTAVINIKTNPKLKAEAQKISSGLGFSLSSLINGYLRSLVRTKTIHFSLVENMPNKYMVQALAESEEDRKKGRFKSFRSTDKALNFIDDIINDGKKN